jgi:peptide/nickel transport system substrate-binding protein
MTRYKMLFAVLIVLLIGSFPDVSQGAQAKDDILKIVAAQEPLTMDLSQVSSGNDRIVIENWGEFLLRKDTNGKIVPGLAASWKVSADGKRMDFTLRKGVKFHSGDLFTAKDVLFSWERGRELNKGVKSGMLRVESMEIVNDYQISVYFKQPDVLFIPNLAFAGMVSKSYHERVGEETFAKQPSGTGPYKFVSYRPGEYVDIERFEEYWGKKPPIKKARIYFVGEDTTRVSKLKAGEVDLIQAVPFTDVKELEGSPNFKVVKLATLQPTRSVIFGTNNLKMPWSDKRVRLAMALAVDCKSIINNVLQGIPIYVVGLAPHELGYDPQLKPYGYDPKKAKALLSEAGYPKGFDLKFYWQVGGRSAMTQEIVEAVASYWEAVGIRAKLIGEDTAASLARRNNALKPDAEYVAFYTAGYTGGVDPTQPLNGYFSGDGARPVYTTQELTKVINDAISTMDDKKRAELIKKAGKLIHEEVGFVPVHSTITVYGMKKNIDFTPTKGDFHDFLFVKDMAFK